MKNNVSIKKITRSEMVASITKSGYLMEQRIFPVIESKEFYVETNPVFPDQITGKSREYDFSAIYVESLYKEEFNLLYTHIIGECINNLQPIVFFTSDSPIDFLNCMDLKCSGIPLYFPDKQIESEFVSLQDFFRFDKFHHYCKGTFSTQYCSFRKKKGKKEEWLAWHDDEHHGLFNNLIGATRYEVEEDFSSWFLPEKDEEEQVGIHLYYPLLIVRDDLYECQQLRGKPSLKKRKHIQFRKSLIFDNAQDTYQIDVIVESFLKKYIDILLKESKLIKSRLQRKKKDVKHSLDIIVSKAKKDKKLENFREILEF
jgi:hypothetical protein